MKNLLVAQSGGPSAAINATLAGVVEKAMTNQNVGKIYGAKNGIMGILTDKLIDLTETLADPETLQLLWPDTVLCAWLLPHEAVRLGGKYL